MLDTVSIQNIFEEWVKDDLCISCFHNLKILTLQMPDYHQHTAA